MVPLCFRLSLYRLFTAPSSRGTMVSMFTLLSSLLLVSAVLAVPSSLAEASGFTRGHEDPQSRPISLVASTPPGRLERDATNWAGAIVDMSQKKVRIIPMVHDRVRSHIFCRQPRIQTVAGTIIVPRLVALQDDECRSNIPIFWVGMGVLSCPDFALQAGLTIDTIDGKSQYVGEERQTSAPNLFSSFVH